MTERQVSLEFVFDRATDQLLAQAYRMLVPERQARADQRGDDDESTQATADDSARDGDAVDRRALGA